MAPQNGNNIKRAKLQHQEATSSAAAHQVLILFLLLSLYLSQRSLPVASQDNNFATNGKTSFESSSSAFGLSSKGGPSKTSNNLNSRFNFREHIVHLQRKQQQQQVIEQKQHQVVEHQQQEQQLVVEQKPVQQQRVAVEQSIDSQQEQQQLVGGSRVVEQSSSIYGSIKGTPGVDFPAYSSIPNTKFSCAGAPHDPGMYADETTGCQVYHMCYQGRRESFLCGEGTVFNQAIMNCDFWHSVDCSRSSSYYNLNADFGKSASEPSASGGSSSFFQQRVLQAAQLPSLPALFAQRTYQLEEQSYSGATKGGGGGLSGTRTVNSNFGIKSTKSAAPLGSIRDHQQFSSQRESVHSQTPLSPSRRANQLSGLSDQSVTHGNKFSSAESSPMRSIAATAERAGSLQVQPVERVGASLTVANELVETETKGSSRVESQANTNYASWKGPESTKQQQARSAEEQEAGKTSLLEVGRKGVNSANDDTNDVWRPYFKSKTKTRTQAVASKSGGGKGGATQSQSIYPSLTGGKSTIGAPEAPDRPDENATTERPSTSAQPPDQEPNFGGGSAPSTESPATTGTSAEATETPGVPKSGPPPAGESTADSATTDQTTTASPGAIESDVGQALSPTTPAGQSGSSRPTDAPVTTTAEQASSSQAESLPQTTTTLKPVTETASSQQANKSSAPATTTSATVTTDGSPATTTTTTVAPTTTVTPAASSESSTPAGEGGEREESSSEAEAQKKRRGTLTAGVEYATETTAKKKSKKKKSKPMVKITMTRANSSSVEYAIG